jgi:ABC-type sugar transport system permease subunit
MTLAGRRAAGADEGYNMEIKDFKPTLPIIALTILLLLIFGFLNNFALFMQLTGLTNMYTNYEYFGSPRVFYQYYIIEGKPPKLAMDYTALIVDLLIFYIIGGFIALGLKGTHKSSRALKKPL